MSDVISLVDKATSALLLDIDWDTTLQIVDLIRQGDITPKSAVSALLTKIHDSNPNVVILALQVLESVVKNCGQVIHEHVATRDFMEEIRVLLKSSTNEEVQNKILMLLATWVYAFRTEPKYRAVQDTVNILKAEGFKIRSVVESDAMFTADSAPDWADGECCHRCRSQFTMLRRKHHCRACGQVFCGDCSNKTSTIPKFGIEREVRVCDYCYEDINNGIRAASLPKTESSSTEKPTLEKSSNPNKKTAEELQEEEELQLALALSKSEAENKEKEKLRATYNILGSSWHAKQSSPTPKSVSSTPISQEESDPELAKYLNRSYWEQQRQKHKSKEAEAETSPRRALSPSHPSAPSTVVKGTSSMKAQESFQNGGVGEVDEFVSTLRGQLEIFVNRMKSNQSRGRPIANDTAVQSLFMNITAMHAQLLTFIQEQDRKRVHCEQLQDKISQIRDARAALDALREEHREKVRRDREEQERIRQMQMMQKLEIMRKKKQEYLEYQRQLALHRMAESERQILSAQHGPPHSGHPGGPPGFAPQMTFPPSYPPHTQMGGYMYPGHGGDNPQNQGIVPPFQGPQPPMGQSIQPPVGPSIPPPVGPPMGGFSTNHPPNSEYGHYNIPPAASAINMPNYGPPITSPPGTAPPPQISDPQMIPPPQQQPPPPPTTTNLQHQIPGASPVPLPPEEHEAPLISFD